MKRLTCLFSCVLALWCVIYLTNPADAARPKYLIKFATVAPEGSTWVKRMRAIDKEIRKKSGGRLGFRIYAGGIAGDESDVLKKIRIGQIHCAAFSGVGFGHILPMVRVLDLPFLFKNDQEVDLVHKKLSPFFSEEFRKKGFELLAWAEVGNVHLISKKPIRKVQDLSGLKVWTWSGDPIAKETFVAMGVTPIPLAVTDVTTALNTGMIDTVYAPPLGALALQWQNYLNDMMALPLAHSTGAILISSKYYKKLPEDLAQLLKSTLETEMAELTTQLRDQTGEAMEIIRKSGVTILPVPEGTALERFQAIGTVVARKLTGEIYPKELLDRVYQILNQSNP
ncbi:MAG: TRAP transporter substrate-binding protein DctP [Deltaproteobacteria bacterium]|nr:TRAP transporter substrate-binding protein DctP [Deltaproteobacteria bacterium]